MKVPIPVCVFMVLILIGTSVLTGSSMQQKQMQQQAVEAGAAEWVVVDSAGKTEFRWKGRVGK